MTTEVRRPFRAVKSTSGGEVPRPLMSYLDIAESHEALRAQLPSVVAFRTEKAAKEAEIASVTTLLTAALNQLAAETAALIEGEQASAEEKVKSDTAAEDEADYVTILDPLARFKTALTECERCQDERQRALKELLSLVLQSVDALNAARKLVDERNETEVWGLASALRTELLETIGQWKCVKLLEAQNNNSNSNELTGGSIIQPHTDFAGVPSAEVLRRQFVEPHSNSQSAEPAPSGNAGASGPEKIRSTEEELGELEAAGTAIQSDFIICLELIQSPDFENLRRDEAQFRSEIQETLISLTSTWSNIPGIPLAVGSLSRELQKNKSETAKLQAELAAADNAQGKQKGRSLALHEALSARYKGLEFSLRRMEAATSSMASLCDLRLRLAREDRDYFETRAKNFEVESGRADGDRLLLADLLSDLESKFESDIGYWRPVIALASETAVLEGIFRDEAVIKAQKGLKAAEVEDQDARSLLGRCVAERDVAQQQQVESVGLLKTVQSAATVVANGLQSLGITVLSARNGEPVQIPALDPDKYKIVIENQRCYVNKWSGKLLPTDRPGFTGSDGFSPSPSPEEATFRHLGVPGQRWCGPWTVLPIGDSQGWIYAVDFPATYYSDSFPTAFARRRIHIRRYEFVEPRRELPKHGQSYFIRPKHAQDKVFGCLSGRTDKGTILVIFDRDGTANQKWLCVTRHDGLFSFVPSHAMKMKLDTNSGVGKCCHLWTGDDSSNPNQAFELEPELLENGGQEGRAGEDPTPTAQPQQQGNASFPRRPSPTGYFFIKRKKDGAVLEVRDAGKVNGAQIFCTDKVTGAPHQQFWFDPVVEE